MRINCAISKSRTWFNQLVLDEIESVLNNCHEMKETDIGLRWAKNTADQIFSSPKGLLGNVCIKYCSKTWSLSWREAYKILGKMNFHYSMKMFPNFVIYSILKLLISTICTYNYNHTRFTVTAKRRLSMSETSFLTQR